MTFLEFIFELPFPYFVNYFLSAFLVFLVAFGIYRFVKDWLPW